MTQIIKSYKDKIIFGKYKGKLFEQVLADNSQYIKWAIDEKILDIQNEEMNKVINTCTTNKWDYKQEDNDNWELEEELYWRDMPY